MTEPLIRRDFAPWPTHPQDGDQLRLPIGPDLEQEVHWLHGTVPAERAQAGLKSLAAMLGVAGTTMAHRYIQCDTYAGVVRKSVIDAQDIGELTDPDLRYALRLASAAQSLGLVERAPGHKSGHLVTVVATGEGVDSRFVTAFYGGDDGEDDSFMSDLKTAGPT